MNSFSVITVIAQDNYQAVPYTLADSDRLIQVEAKVDALEKRIYQLDQSLNKQIDRLEDKFDTYFTWGFEKIKSVWICEISGIFDWIFYIKHFHIEKIIEIESF